MRILEHGHWLVLAGSVAIGGAMGLMWLAGYPWWYPGAVVAGLIAITLGNAVEAWERIRALGALQKEVEVLRGRIAEEQQAPAEAAVEPRRGPPTGSGVPQVPPAALPILPQSVENRFRTATEMAAAAISSLFGAWRGKNPKGWWEDFIDEALMPAFSVALKKVDPALLGTQEKVRKSQFGPGDRKP